MCDAQKKQDEEKEISPGITLHRTLKGHTGGVRGLAFTPEGRFLLSASLDRTLRLWDLETGAELRRFGWNAAVTAVAVLPDGRRAVSGQGVIAPFEGAITEAPTTQHELCLWDLETGTELHRFKGHAGEVWALSVTPDGRRVLSALLTLP